MNIPLGSKVGKYQIIHLLYTGDHSAVYLDSSKQFALKISEKDLTSEIHLMKAAACYHVVPVIESFKFKSYFCLVMPYAKLGDAFTLIEENINNESIIKHVINQLIHVVSYLHSKHICHHDIKPENILLFGDSYQNFHIKLGDFGSAEFFDPTDPTHKPHYSGTTEYAPPEILLSKDYGFNIDEWSIGVTMAILLSNLMPYAGNSPKIILQQIFHKYIKLPPDVSPYAQDLLDKLLCIDNKVRISAHDALKHKWFKTLENDKNSIEKKNSSIAIAFSANS